VAEAGSPHWQVISEMFWDFQFTTLMSCIGKCVVILASRRSVMDFVNGVVNGIPADTRFERTAEKRSR
jgi:hypothetical protein